MKKLTTREIANYLRMDQQMVRYYLRTGQIKGKKIGTDWFVSQKDLDRYIIERQ